MKENHSLEFKQALTNSFLKTVSAFANFGTGKILFGVDDDGKVIGLEHPDSVRLDVENSINDSVRPKPEYTLDLNPRTHVLTLTVYEGRYKPYLYKGKAYRRSDTATVEVDQVELKRLTLEGENLYYEELPCGEETLSFHLLGEKLKETLGISGVNSDVLRTLGLINQDKRYTNAAALLADRNTFSGTDVARFGSSISEILDRETFAGVSILQQYDGAVTMFRRYYQYETITGIQRKTISLIPETAFREALANALVHRTWDVQSHIRVLMFSDRIEILSPGGLPRGITLDEYLHGYISNLRNPVIGNIFFRLHYIEMFGTGIRRMLDAYAQAERKPAFEVTENSVKVVLPTMENLASLTADGERVLDTLSGARLSSSEVALQLGWSKDKALRVLKELVDTHYAKRLGSGRGTKYTRS